MKSIVEDLRDDISILNNQIIWHKVNSLTMDSLIEGLNTPGRLNATTNNLYYWGRITSRNNILYNNDRTIEQMKSAGTIRLIRSQEASDNIINYYKVILQVHYLESRDAEEQNDYIKIAVKIFDPSVFNTITKDTTILRPRNNPALLNSDPLLLKELAGYVQYIKSTRATVMNKKERLKVMANELIITLNKIYN